MFSLFLYLFLFFYSLCIVATLKCNLFFINSTIFSVFLVSSQCSYSLFTIFFLSLPNLYHSYMQFIKVSPLIFLCMFSFFVTSLWSLSLSPPFAVTWYFVPLFFLFKIIIFNLYMCSLSVPSPLDILLHVFRLSLWVSCFFSFLFIYFTSFSFSSFHL